MVRLASLFLSLACSALASPFVRPADSSWSGVINVGSFIHERAISKAITKPAIVCDLTCKACLAKPAAKKGKDAGQGKTSGTDTSAANEYVMEQIDSVAGKDDELDWNLIQHDAVSGQGSWAEKPLRKYIRGLMGCTGIVIVSAECYWFLDRGDKWKNKTIKPFQQGTNKFITTRSLAKSGGILNKANNVKIYVSTPRTKTSTEKNPVLLYKAKIDELLSHITGRSELMNGVQVITRGYLKPESEVEVQAFHNRANGKVLIEYDNNQLDVNGNQPNPRERTYRIWLEHKYYEHMFH
ncbi:hypothetical protein FGADI_1119 [Fusarium gaditjirri]|uniref:Uncharacterized protein n=1 Tax=Fusarium gaditjirri TaxID=282569 RepID=A0A8H4TLI2_9HYPO|nr:hypothetical protein FGADI_1119 [Fusarium gaditjirri]